MKSECIDYRALPGQNPLFLTYLYDFERVADFYRPIPADSAQWRERVEEVRQREGYPRNRLVELLEEFNHQIGSGLSTAKNLEKLRDPETVAVVTGQQVGLLGGPSYSVYKAATAIQLTRRLESMGQPAVPIFWLASDDSDFDEVKATYFFDQDGEIFSVAHPDTRKRQAEMAGTVQIGSSDEWLARFREVAGSGLEAGPLRELLLRSYKSPLNFREAFASWMSQLFESYGLIFFDPLLPGYRQDLVEFYEKAIRERERLLEVSLERKAQLEESGFRPQVWVDSSESFLFWVDGAERYKLEFDGGYYSTKGRLRLRFTPDELIARLRDGALLSPNVLLRPILQDYLFPTAVGVTGPSEIAYYSQVNALSPFWDRTMCVYPRAAFTIVDRKAQRLLEQYQIQAADVISSGQSQLSERILRNGDSGRIFQEMDELRLQLEERLERIRLQIADEDPTVSQMLGNAEKKIFYQLEKVSHRFVTNQREHRQYLRRHIRYLRNHLVPADKLQERVINFNCLQGVGGEGFLDELVNMIQPDCLSHRIVYL